MGGEQSVQSGGGYPQYQQRRQPQSRQQPCTHRRSGDLEWDTDRDARWGGRKVGEYAYQPGGSAVHGASLHGRMHCQAGRGLQPQQLYRIMDGQYKGYVGRLERWLFCVSSPERLQKADESKPFSRVSHRADALKLKVVHHLTLRCQVLRNDPNGGSEPCAVAKLNFQSRDGRSFDELIYVYPDREAGGRFVFPLQLYRR